MRLDIPAAPQFLSTARLVAASVGADAGLSVDDLEDLRLGVDELVAMLIERAAPDARIRLEVTVMDGQVAVDGALDSDAVPDAPPPDALTERIVAAVADTYELGPNSFRLQKSAPDRGR